MTFLCCFWIILSFKKFRGDCGEPVCGYKSTILLLIIQGFWRNRLAVFFGTVDKKASAPCGADAVFRF